MYRVAVTRVGHALLLLMPFGIAWGLDLTGWSREQAFAAAILAGTALLWMTEPWHGVPASVAAVLPVRRWWS